MNNDSSWAGQHDTAVDRAIDRAVREMMQIDPPPGLRRRVLSRLESPAARRTFSLAPYAWAAAASMILVIGIIVARDRTTAPAGPAATAQSVQTAAAPTTAPQVRAPEPPPAAPTPDGSTAKSRFTHEPIHMPRVHNVFGPRSPAVAATDARADARVADPAAGALNAVPALVIEPLLPATLDTLGIVVPPLEIPAPKGGLQK
jgi:hypothetical protein